MKKSLPAWATLALLLALAGCSNTPARKIHPSTASIQQLAVQPDGEWVVTLRIENFSTVAMHYDRIEARLEIDGVAAGTLAFDPGIDVIANSGDVVETRLRPGLRLRADTDFAYRLEGTIHASEPRAEFKLDRASRLSPVPGVAATWR